MFTLLRHFDKKQRERSRERNKLEQTVSSKMKVEEEDLILLKNLPEELLKILKDTSTSSPTLYNMFYNASDKAGDFKKDDRLATIMIIKDDLYLVLLPDPASEVSHLDFSRINWIQNMREEEKKVIAFTSEMGINIGHILDQDRHLVAKPLEEAQINEVRHKLGIHICTSALLEKYCLIDQEISETVQVDDMGKLLGEIQDEKYFRPETGYWINDQGKIWIRTGRIINSNNRLHKESTEKFEINLGAWLHDQELIRKPIVEEKDFFIPKQN